MLEKFSTTNALYVDTENGTKFESCEKVQSLRSY